jgi:hypothetical protein
MIDELQRGNAAVAEGLQQSKIDARLAGTSNTEKLDGLLNVLQHTATHQITLGDGMLMLLKQVGHLTNTQHKSPPVKRTGVYTLVRILVLTERCNFDGLVNCCECVAGISVHYSC